MPQPTASDVHVDAILTNISIAYLQSNDGFIATKVFPIIPVEKQSDKYFVFDRNAFMRDEMQLRAESTESVGSGYTVSTDGYSCDVKALHKDVSDRVRQNSDNPLNADRNATQFLTQQAMQSLERKWTSDFFGPGIWGTDITPANLWSSYGLSTPIADVRAGKRAILSTTGFEPNTLVLGYDVYVALLEHPDIVDRIKYSAGGVVTTQLLAQLFEIPRVLIAKGVKATNLEGETAAYGFIQGKHALLTYAAPSPSVESPSAGYTFEWRGVSQGLGAGVAVSRYRMDLKKSDRLEIESAWDNKIVSTELGYSFNSVVA